MLHSTINKDVLIETYKGYNIYFSSSDDKFYCKFINTSGNKPKVKKLESIRNIRKSIDEFLTKSLDFEPFYVEIDPKVNNFNQRDKIKVINFIGNNIIAEEENGARILLSNESDYILCNPEYDEIIEKIYKIRSEYNTLMFAKLNEEHKITDYFKPIRLKDYKDIITKKIKL